MRLLKLNINIRSMASYISAKFGAAVPDIQMRNGLVFSSSPQVDKILNFLKMQKTSLIFKNINLL